MNSQGVAIAAVSDIPSASLSQDHVSELPLPRPLYDTVDLNMNQSSATTSFVADSQDHYHAAGPHSSPSNNSQVSAADAVTPPTSQELSQSEASHLSHLSQIVAAQLSSQSTRHFQEPLPVANTAGQKRTIDGHVKPSGSTSPESPDRDKSQALGHSRNTSLMSTASSTASTRELTAELRTRLSYAMIKVNKGWESLPIDEVESLASQGGSPATSTSTVHARRPVVTSPRAAIANVQGRHQDSLGFDTAFSAPNVSQEQVSITSSQPSRTYESFWREQYQRQTAGVSSTQSSQHSVAPSDDLGDHRQSSNPPRSYTPKVTKPSMLQIKESSDFGHGKQLTVGTGPHTPSRGGGPADALMQTPTQKSVQEQDAIETLLFMSSPGNSSSMGHTFPPSQGRASQLHSPLRADFGPSIHQPQSQDAEFSSMASNADGRQSEAAKARSPNRNTFRRLDADEIDRLLDSTPDPESSGDELEIPITPRRRVAPGPA